MMNTKKPLIPLFDVDTETLELTAPLSLKIVLNINNRLRKENQSLKDQLDYKYDTNDLHDKLRMLKKLKHEHYLFKKLYFKFLETCPEEFAGTNEIIELIDQCDDVLGL